MSRHEKYEIEVGKIYESNNCGDYLVLNDDKNGKRKGYTIRFINTGYEKWVRNKQVVMGSVYDSSISNDLFLGKVFNSNSYGRFVLVGVSYLIDNSKSHNRKHYVIRFLNTGHQQSEQSHHLWTGEVRDKFFDDIPIGYEYESDNQKVTVIAKSRIENHYIVKGHKNNAIWHCINSSIKDNVFVDYLEYGQNKNTVGYGTYINHIDLNIYEKLRLKFDDMMSRCYNENNISYMYYGGKGVTVDKSWHRFDNFLFDCLELEGFDSDKLLNNELELDKDKNQIGCENKIYSKDNCCWLSRIENNNIKGIKKKYSKYFKAKNVETGELIYCNSRNDFANKYNLNEETTKIYVRTERQIPYNGWVFNLIDKEEYLNNKK